MSHDGRSPRDAPITSSLSRFVSDWVGRDSQQLQQQQQQQPPPFRLQRDPSDDAAMPEIATEMHHLIGRSTGGAGGGELAEMAVREWRSITNVDLFLEQLYAYYQGKGLYGILLGRFSNLLILAFVVSFSVLLAYAVDWSFLHQPATAASHPRLVNVVFLSGLHDMSWSVLLAVVAFFGLWSWQVLRLLQHIPSLLAMRRFYQHVLRIEDSELHTYDFTEIVDKILELQKTHPITTDRLNAHDVSNRIMRRENYLIALFNKDILNLDLPFSLLKPVSPLTKTLEWNLSFCIISYVFDGSYAVRKGFLKDVRREELSQGLKKRLVLMGIVNLVLAPFIFAFLLVYFCLRYGEEIYRNPRTIGMRQYSTAARWKLREFNELPHYFNRRLANSYRKATKYKDQFYSDRMASLARLVSFVAGSFAFVLLIITIINEDLLMHFEITAGKSVIWYIGFFGTILAITRALIPDVLNAHDPTRLMNEIIEYTHYLPKHWRGRFHTEKVHREFSSMFDYKFVILFQELVSVAFTPFVLIFSLPQCTDKIVDFFREFTVHVDGIGYVCSFALFDFRRHGNPRYGGDAADKYHRTRQGKMEKSFLSFVANNPNWSPDEMGSLYLGKLQKFEMAQSQQRFDGHNPSATAATAASSDFLQRPPIHLQPMREMLSSINSIRSPAVSEATEGEDAPLGAIGLGNGIISILNKYYEQHSNDRF